MLTNSQNETEKEDRLVVLRAKMAQYQLDAYIIGSADAHQSEIPAHYYEARHYFSQFTGTAGTLVVLATEAALWTDGRYFLQAELELPASITLMRSGEAGTPTMAAYLKAKLSSGQKIGFDALCTSLDTYNELERTLEGSQIELIGDDELIDTCWPADLRPVLRHRPIYHHQKAFYGLEAAEKIIKLRAIMREKGFDGYFISSLDDVAWLTNLRSSEIENTPVFYSYFWLGTDEAVLFTQQDLLDAEAKIYLATQNITIEPYSEAFRLLAKAYGTVALDPSRTSTYVVKLVAENNQLASVKELTAELKMVKSAAEITGFRAAHRLDGLAMIKFLAWYEEAVVQKEYFTEYDLSEQLEAMRKIAVDFVDMSFPSITSFGENGAIIHYSVEEESAKAIEGTGFTVVDSGAQYRSGTTDITRTLSIGALSAQQKRDYTTVLKAIIMLSQSRFIAGANGVQLDGICRYHLWQTANDYKHGTGHGVGSFLAVHEGPIGLNKNNTLPLPLGAVVSIEPGIYRAHEYGIRLENLYVVQEAEASYAGQFYKFECLTMVPFDLKSIDRTMLTDAEVAYINAYHAEIAALYAEDVANDLLLKNYLKVACAKLV